MQMFDSMSFDQFTFHLDYWILGHYFNCAEIIIWIKNCDCYRQNCLFWMNSPKMSHEERLYKRY